MVQVLQVTLQWDNIVQEYKLALFINQNLSFKFWLTFFDWSRDVSIFYWDIRLVNFSETLNKIAKSKESFLEAFEKSLFKTRGFVRISQPDLEHNFSKYQFSLFLTYGVGVSCGYNYLHIRKDINFNIILSKKQCIFRWMKWRASFNYLVSGNESKLRATRFRDRP